MQVTARMAAVNVVATAVCSGLGVLGWGGFDAFFSHPPLLALSLITLALVAAGMFTAGNVSSGKQEARNNRWVLAVFAVIGLLMSWLPAYTDRKEVWTLDGDVVRWLGVLLYAGGGVLRIWPVFVLGNRFSGLVAIQEATYPRDNRYLRGDPPPELSRPFDHMSLGWALGSGPARDYSDRLPPRAIDRPYPCRRDVAAIAFRRGVQIVIGREPPG